MQKTFKRVLAVGLSRLVIRYGGIGFFDFRSGV